MIDGYSGARQKGFSTLEDAEAYVEKYKVMDDGQSSVPKSEADK